MDAFLPPSPTARIPPPLELKEAKPYQQIPFVPPPSQEQPHNLTPAQPQATSQEGMLTSLYAKAKDLAHSGLSFLKSTLQYLRRSKKYEEEEHKEFIKLKDMGSSETHKFKYYPSLEVQSKRKEDKLTQSQMETVKHLSREQKIEGLKSIEEFSEVQNLKGDELILPTDGDLERIKRIHKLS